MVKVWVKFDTSIEWISVFKPLIIDEMCHKFIGISAGFLRPLFFRFTRSNTPFKRCSQIFHFGVCPALRIYLSRSSSRPPHYCFQSWKHTNSRFIMLYVGTHFLIIIDSPFSGMINKSKNLIRFEER